MSDRLRGHRDRGHHSTPGVASLSPKQFDRGSHGLAAFENRVDFAGIEPGAQSGIELAARERLDLRPVPVIDPGHLVKELGAGSEGPGVVDQESGSRRHPVACCVCFYPDWR